MSELYIGVNEPIECCMCGHLTGMRDTGISYEGYWVNKCWTCGFQWSDWMHEENGFVMATEVKGGTQ